MASAYRRTVIIMKIAVINEVSTRTKNKDILAGLDKLGLETINVGMSDDPAEPELSYIHTGFMAGAVLNLGLADIVIGGCGTGQGFLISSMQYPNVYCGLIIDPVDAFLFSQINAGNCVSLPMNKGYGWAGELNLAYIFEKLFIKEPGSGYPPERAEFQNISRNLLKGVNQSTHKTFMETLAVLDKSIIKTALSHKPFYELVKAHNPEGLENIIRGL